MILLLLTSTTDSIPTTGFQEKNAPIKISPQKDALNKIIFWILFVSNFIFIEIFDQKLKLISLNIFWFLITICSLSFFTIVYFLIRVFLVFN